MLIKIVLPLTQSLLKYELKIKNIVQSQNPFFLACQFYLFLLQKHGIWNLSNTLAIHDFHYTEIIKKFILVKRGVDCLEDGRFYRNPERNMNQAWTNHECSKYYLCLGKVKTNFKVAFFIHDQNSY